MKKANLFGQILVMGGGVQESQVKVIMVCNYICPLPYNRVKLYVYIDSSRWAHLEGKTCPRRGNSAVWVQNGVSACPRVANKQKMN